MQRLTSVLVSGVLGVMVAGLGCEGKVGVSANANVPGVNVTATAGGTTTTTPPPPPPPPAEPELRGNVTRKGSQIIVEGNIEFPSGGDVPYIPPNATLPAGTPMLPGHMNFPRDVVRGNANFRIFTQIVQILRDNPQLTLVRVEGHTDTDGSPIENQNLSQRRAQNVVMALQFLGKIDPNRLRAVGCGQRTPLYPETSAEAKQRNRRVEFDIETINGNRLKSYTDECMPNPYYYQP